MYYKLVFGYRLWIDLMEKPDYSSGFLLILLQKSMPLSILSERLMRKDFLIERLSD